MLKNYLIKKMINKINLICRSIIIIIMLIISIQMTIIKIIKFIMILWINKIINNSSVTVQWLLLKIVITIIQIQLTHFIIKIIKLNNKLKHFNNSLKLLTRIIQRTAQLNRQYRTVNKIWLLNKLTLLKNHACLRLMINLYL